MFSTALFNGVMAIITATALWSARRNGRPRSWFLTTLAVGAAAVLLAVCLAEDRFGALRLLAYGLFGFVAFVWIAAVGVTQPAGGRTLIVSRGVGMERGAAPRLRFLCRPELVVIELVPL
ncbi:MAG TPA: hypothetical protein VNH11_13230 [Pirellulales bacterium]|nr:hypothetical protein [Pirellulales bacterium]